MTDEGVTPTQNSDLRTFARAFYDVGQAPRPQNPLRADGRGFKADEDWERRVEAEIAKASGLTC